MRGHTPTVDMPTAERLDELTQLLVHGVDPVPAVLARSARRRPAPQHGPRERPAHARRLCQYLRELDEGARPWVLTGREIDVGPDNEPLLDEARELYRRRLDTGRATHQG